MSCRRDATMRAHLVEAEAAVDVVERRPLEHRDRTDVHRRLRPLEVQEALVERGEAVVPGIGAHRARAYGSDGREGRGRGTTSPAAARPPRGPGRASVTALAPKSSASAPCPARSRARHELELVGPLVEQRDPPLHRVGEPLGRPQFRAAPSMASRSTDDDPRRCARAAAFDPSPRLGSGGTAIRATARLLRTHSALASRAYARAERRPFPPPHPTISSTSPQHAAAEQRLRRPPLPSALRSGAGYRGRGGSVLCRAGPSMAVTPRRPRRPDDSATRHDERH